MAKQKPLVCKHLENISGDVLSRYRNVIRDFVKGVSTGFMRFTKRTGFSMSAWLQIFGPAWAII